MRLFCLATMLSCAIAAANPDAEPAQDEHPTRQFSVEVKFIQVEGEPDWAFWGEPYGRPHEFSEGAGRVFGPVDITSRYGRTKTWDTRKLGFVETPEHGGIVISSPRLTTFLDYGDLLADGIRPKKYLVVSDTSYTFRPSRKVEDSDDAIAQAYNQLAQKPRTFSKGELDSKGAIVSLTGSDPAEGALFMIEAKSTDTSGIYRLDQSVVMNSREWKKGRDTNTKGSRMLHAQFDCSYDVADNSETVFLVPVAERQYVLLWSNFHVFTDKESASIRERQELDAALENGPVIRSRASRTSQEAPYLADVTLLRVKGRVAYAPDASPGESDSSESLRRYGPGAPPKAVVTGGIQIGETLVRLGEAAEPIPDELLQPSATVSGLRASPIALPADYASTTLDIHSNSPYAWIEAPGAPQNPSSDGIHATLRLQTTLTERGDVLDVHWATDTGLITGYKDESESFRPVMTDSREYTHFETTLGHRVAIMTALGTSVDEVLVTFITFTRNETP